MPQRRAPVEGAAGPGAGGVHGEDGAEAHAERADAGESDRAHGEVRVPVVDLDRDRRRRLESVADAHSVERLLGERRGVDGEGAGLLRVHGETEARTLHRLEPGQLLEEVERVEHPDVEGIALEGGLEGGVPGLDFARAELVQAEFRHAGPGQGIEGHGLPRELDRIGVPVRAVGDLREGDVEVGVARVQPQHAVARLREGRRVPPEVGGGRDLRPRGEGDRVRLQRAPGLRLGLVHILEFEIESRQEGPGLGEAGVRLKRLLGEFERLRGAVELRAARLRQEGARVGRVPGQRLLDQRTGLGAVVLVEKEETEVDARLGVAGIRFDGLLEGAHRVVEEVGVARSEVGESGADGAQLLGIEAPRAVVEVDEPIEQGEGFLALAAAEEEPAQVEPRELRVAGPAFDGQAEVRLGLVEAPERVEQTPARAGKFGVGVRSVRRARGGPVERVERGLVLSGRGERSRPPARGGRELAAGTGQRPVSRDGLPIVAGLVRLDGGIQGAAAVAARALLCARRQRRRERQREQR